MAERRALLLAAVDTFLHRVDIHERHHVLAGQQRRAAGQVRQQQPGSPSPPAGRSPRRTSAGTTPAWTVPGSRQTAPASRHAAAGPCRRCCPPRRPSRRPGTALSGAHSPRTGRRWPHARRPARQGRPAAPGPSPGPGPPVTRDSGHQTMRESSPARATIALARCPLHLGNGSVSNSHRPSSEGTFRVGAPGRTLFTRWIEALAKPSAFPDG